MSALFIILVSLTVSLFSEKVLVSNRCIIGLMSNLIKKSWTDSIIYLFSLILYILYFSKIFIIIVPDFAFWVFLFFGFFYLPTSHLGKAAHFMTSLFAWTTHPTFFFDLVTQIRERPLMTSDDFCLFWPTYPRPILFDRHWILKQ